MQHKASNKILKLSGKILALKSISAVDFRSPSVKTSCYQSIINQSHGICYHNQNSTVGNKEVQT